ncbi:MAG: pyruvate synthase subunit PorD [archaeon]
MKLTTGAVIDEPGSTIKNKTGGWRTLRPEWDEKKCTQCMICWQFCPDACIPDKGGKRSETDLDFCKGCGICEDVCPVKAIKMVKEEK